MITDTDENQGKSQEIGLILFKDIWDFNKPSIDFALWTEIK